MTKEALKTLNMLIENQTKYYDGLIDPHQSWNLGFDSVGNVAKILVDRGHDELKVLKYIRKQLNPVCNHPKNMSDKLSNGQWYCMKCNGPLIFL